MGQSWFSKIITITVINQLPYEVFVKVNDNFERLNPYSPLHCTPPPFEHRPNCTFTANVDQVWANLRITRITEKGVSVPVIPEQWFKKSEVFVLDEDTVRYLNAKPADEETTRLRKQVISLQREIAELKKGIPVAEAID